MILSEPTRKEVQSVILEFCFQNKIYTLWESGFASNLGYDIKTSYGIDIENECFIKIAKNRKHNLEDFNTQ